MVDLTATSKTGKVRIVRYDDFAKPSGYGVGDYLEKWANIYGPGEMADTDTRRFSDGVFRISATPFKTGADESVLDHIKYFAASTETFQVPENGSVTLEANVNARTTGVKEGRIIKGTYGPGGSYPDGKPYEARLLEAQQAAATLHLIDFQTGQLFDWLVGEGKAMSLVERLPSVVTRSSLPTGHEQMYTQIIREHSIAPGAHRYGIRFWRKGAASGADYLLDGEVVDRIDRIGVPLDRQGVSYSGLWPALGDGEEIGPKVDSVVVAHGLFSLLDAFPFQHPDAPEQSVSIPMSERLFGQGIEGAFGDFVVTIAED